MDSAFKVEEADPLEKVGGRKFLLTVLLVVTSSVFCVVDIMTVEQWLGFNGVLCSGYLGFNVWQKYLVK